MPHTCRSQCPWGAAQLCGTATFAPEVYGARPSEMFRRLRHRGELLDEVETAPLAASMCHNVVVCERHSKNHTILRGDAPPQAISLLFLFELKLLSVSTVAVLDYELREVGAYGPCAISRIEALHPGNSGIGVGNDLAIEVDELLVYTPITRKRLDRCSIGSPYTNDIQAIMTTFCVYGCSWRHTTFKLGIGSGPLKLLST